MHPAELVARQLTKRAFPLAAIPLALAALPTMTYALNRLTGYDPRKKLTTPKQPPAARQQADRSELQQLTMPTEVNPMLQRQMYMRALAQTLAQQAAQGQPSFMTTGYGLRAARGM